MTDKHHRAGPLAPDDRRRAIIEAVLPLLIARGPAVTTRELAEAAGVAEGTIFRVFPDKHALIHEAVKFSMDPEPIRKALSEIYLDAPLETQLAEAARILLEHFHEVMAVVSSLRTMRPIESERPPGLPAFVTEANEVVNRSLAVLFESHRARLRLAPEKSAALFRGLVLVSVHPALGMTDKLSVDEIVDVLLTGVLDPASELVT
jgi:AcrR family transcriptional regulator